MIAAIQAGGRSSRMGQDKAWLSVKGETLISRAISAARSVADRLLIVIDEASPHRKAYLELAQREHADLIFDEEPGRGPLAGIHAALKHVGQGKSLLIMACDLPFVTSQFLEFLVREHARYGKLVTVPRDPEGRLQPLLAVYSTQCLPKIEEHLKRRLWRVDRLFEVVPTHTISPDSYSHLDNPQRLFANINTRADLVAFENGS